MLMTAGSVVVVVIGFWLVRVRVIRIHTYVGSSVSYDNIIRWLLIHE